LDRGEKIPTHLPYLVQRWSFGDDMAMVFLPGEITVDYSLRIKREFDRSRMWVNGYSNDVPCYVPSRRVLDEGGYEGAGAMVYYDRPTKFAPDVEERIMGAVHEVMPKSFLTKAGADQARASERSHILITQICSSCVTRRAVSVRSKRRRLGGTCRAHQSEHAAGHGAAA
jgi:hypothetical protein